MKKVLLGITILIGCLCVFAAQSYAFPTVDDPTTCWQCHKSTSVPKPPATSDFEFGTTWHTEHQGFAAQDCSKCHPQSFTPIQTSSCATCHNSAQPSPPLFGPFPCYWPDNHTQAQRYTCETASCHTSCAPAQTFLISGTVTSSGSGLSGVSMALTGTSSASTTTNASGNYSFSGLSNGSYTVTPSKTGYTLSPTNIAVTISGADQTGKNFTATATGTGCSVWTDVINKYNSYVSGQAAWTDVITCYNQYVAAHP